MRLSAVWFYLFLVSNRVCYRSLQSQPDCCFSNWIKLMRGVSMGSVTLWLMIIVRIDWNHNGWLFFFSLSLSPLFILGATWGSAHSGGISWWGGHSSRGLPPPQWHPSAVRPTRARLRSHSCRTGKTTAKETQLLPGLYTCTHTHRLFVNG